MACKQLLSSYGRICQTRKISEHQKCDIQVWNYPRKFGNETLSMPVQCHTPWHQYEYYPQLLKHWLAEPTNTGFKRNFLLTYGMQYNILPRQLFCLQVGHSTPWLSVGYLQVNVVKKLSKFKNITSKYWNTSPNTCSKRWGSAKRNYICLGKYIHVDVKHD